jgi:Holliday junction DNA helicase RuvA
LIANLRGELDSVGSDHIVLDVQGVGYKVYMPLTCLAQLPELGGKVGMPIVTIVREDSITLYGFQQNAQKAMFELLLGVSGVGPKAALNILSVLSVEEVQDAVSGDKYQLLSRVPGIGAKTAQRIAVDLKDKVSSVVLEGLKERSLTIEEKALRDAIEALVGLGYNRQHARKAAEDSARNEPASEAEAIIRSALNMLSKG